MEQENAEQDTTYQGHKNFPTWAISLWLDNEQPSYEWLRAEALGTLEAFLAEDPRRNPKFMSYKRLGVLDRRTVRLRLSDKVREYVEEKAPDIGSTMFADILVWAVQQVDWQEIAGKALDELDL